MLARPEEDDLVVLDRWLTSGDRAELASIGDRPALRRAAGRRSALRAVALAARGTLHRRCGRCGGTDHGRPVIAARGRDAAPEQCSISVAASGGLVVVALGSGCTVGIDVEQTAPMTPALDDLLERSVCTPREFAWLDAGGPAARAARRARLWARKEAAGKQAGVGVLGLAPFDVLADRVPFGAAVAGAPAAPCVVGDIVLPPVVVAARADAGGYHGLPYAAAWASDRRPARVDVRAAGWATLATVLTPAPHARRREAAP